MLGSTYKSYIRKSQVKQNHIVKILSNKLGKKTRLKPLYKKLNFLKLDGIYKLEVAKIMAKIHLNKLPEFCGDYLKNFMKLFSVHSTIQGVRFLIIIMCHKLNLIIAKQTNP